MENKTYQQKLDFLRTQIDACDDVLIAALNSRMRYCVAVGQLKKEYGITEIQQIDREKEIIERLSKQSTYSNMVETLWPIIMQISRNLQSEIK